MKRERKELYCGSAEECRLFVNSHRNPDALETVPNEHPGPQFSVFYKRKPAFDPTLRKPLFRHTAKPFKHYKRVVIVGLEPGDVLSFRLKGTRRKYSAPIDKLFGVVIAWEAFAAMNAKRAARAAKRKTKK